MPTLNLNPKGNKHGQTKLNVMRQFLFMMQNLKDWDFIENQGAKDTVQSLVNRWRWKSLEGSIIADSARHWPERTAVIDDAGELTYSELWENSNRLARALKRRGVKPGDNVAVLALNSRYTLYPMCARHLIGFNTILINGNSSPAQIERILNFHEIKYFILDDEFYESVKDFDLQCELIIGYNGTAGVNTDGLPTVDGIISEARVTVKIPLKPQSSQLVIMTSGTTGLPKGVIRRNPKSPQTLAPVLAAVPWRQNLTVMVTAVLFHGFGILNTLLGFLSGSTLVLRRHFDPKQSFDDIERYNINAMATAASRIRALLAYKDENKMTDVNQMEFIFSSGSPLTPTEIDRTNDFFGRCLCTMYGSSESVALASASAEELDDDHTLSGIIYPGITIEIRDDEGNNLPEGKVGNIWAAEYDMCVGYTDEEIKIPHDDRGLMPMGDEGYIENGNRLHVLGRADDLIITQYAEKIFPQQIVSTLETNPRIDTAYVHGVEDAQYGQAIRAYIIREEGSTISADEVKKYVKDELSDAHEPRDVFFVDEFPRNPMGKVMKRYLPGKSTVDE